MPYHRHQAFDIGETGLGTTANQLRLRLGCDRLGTIKYFDGYRIKSNGEPVHLENVVCLHEADAGLLYKHTDYRTACATAVRNCQLVLQMICTVANYEYIFAWIFDQAGGIEYEVRATGILSTMPIENENVQRVPWGTNLGPGVMAAYHQHLFCLRVDPAVDGYANTVVYEDSVDISWLQSNVARLPTSPVMMKIGCLAGCFPPATSHRSNSKPDILRRWQHSEDLSQTVLLFASSIRKFLWKPLLARATYSHVRILSPRIA